MTLLAGPARGQVLYGSFRAEVFGATNTPQFGNPGATVSSLTRNADGSIKALNGYTEITSASGERQARFAAKITF